VVAQVTTSLRWRAYAVSLVLAGVVALPLVGVVRSDSFPVSTYPMFAGARGSVVSLPSAVAIGPDGQRDRLPPGLVAGEQVIQAFETLRQAIRGGADRTDALCARIASRLDPEHAASVEIVTERFDAISYFAGEREPLASQVHARCDVGSLRAAAR
jgi:hypothetical protein